MVETDRKKPNGTVISGVTPLDQKALLQALQARDLKSLGIILSKYWWVENLQFRGTRPIDMSLPEMQAIIAVAECVGPNQFKVEWADFTLMIYPPQGKVIFHAKSSFVMNAGLFFIRFMTNKSADTPPGPGLTRQQALDLAGKLRMFYAEEETRILGDSANLLPKKKERLFELIYKPDDPMRKKLLNILVDFSKGGEWVHEGDPAMGGGLAEAILDPLKAVTVMAEVVAFCNSVGQAFNGLNVAAGEGFEKSNQLSAQHAVEVGRIARAVQFLTTDITTLMGQVPADLAMRLDLIQGSLNALANAVAAGMNQRPDMGETNDLLRDAIDATREVQAEIRQGLTHIDEEQTERLRDLEDITDQTKALLEHHHQDSVIRDNARAIQLERVAQALEKYHRGVIRNETYVSKKMQVLERGIALAHARLDDVASRLKKTSRWIRKNAREYYETTLAILEEMPNITAKQLAAILEVKPTRVYYWLKRLADFNLIGRVQQAGSAQGSGSQPEENHEPAKKRVGLRRVWHYFLRTIGKESKTQSNEQIKPEDEKT